MRLKGKVALVTGGNKGIGAAVVRRFASEGARVWSGDIATDKANKFSDDLANKTETIVHETLDVTSHDSWQLIINKIVHETGKIDILVNNAGIYDRRSIEETTEEQFLIDGYSRTVLVRSSTTTAWVVESYSATNAASFSLGSLVCKADGEVDCFVLSTWGLYLTFYYDDVEFHRLLFNEQNSRLMLCSTAVEEYAICALGTETEITIR